ncbi:MAG: hypothetical protein DI607_09355 [Sphingomonas hengshuiensis]|nr:MAG: hypothetical protein DI607_09355 [Sphingomonas hengshuiensis]
MTAIKPRPPQSFEAAIVRAIGILGRDGAAAAVGKSETLVYSWGDPDKDQEPSLKQAFALDAACAGAAGETPIRDVYDRRLMCVGRTHVPLPPAERLLSGLSAMGDLAIEVRLAIDPASAGGCGITATEGCRIGSAIDEIRATLDRLEMDVARCTQGASR